MLNQVKGMLNPWAEGIRAIDSNFETLATNTQSVGAETSKIQGEVAKILKDFCPDTGSCVDKTLADFKQQGQSCVVLNSKTQADTINTIMTI